MAVGGAPGAFGWHIKYLERLSKASIPSKRSCTLEAEWEWARRTEEGQLAL